jgi:D-serine deaminase-like pyridoxal phosphate-dependent protein
VGVPATPEPATPYHRVDVARLRHNVRRVAEQARAAGVALRPHAKTHKSAEVARVQLAEGATGITVATVAEAEAFVAAGVDDVFVAYPLWTDASTGARLRGLLDHARIAVGTDSVQGAEALARHCGSDVDVLVEVDSGHHRTGVAPGAAGALAAAAVGCGLGVRGVFTFPGHSYGPALGAVSAHDERTALATAARSLAAAGVEPRVVSGGSTPSLADSLADPGPLTELRPGVYVFGDAQQWELGAHRPDDVALTCRGTVVSLAGGRVVLDAGSKALGADRPPWTTGWGRVAGRPEARVVLLSEHHAVLDWGAGDLPTPGSRVDVVPNHVCAAVNLADRVWADHGDGDLEPWPVLARGPGG